MASLPVSLPRQQWRAKCDLWAKSGSPAQVCVFFTNLYYINTNKYECIVPRKLDNKRTLERESCKPLAATVDLNFICIDSLIILPPVEEGGREVKENVEFPME